MDPKLSTLNGEPSIEGETATCQEIMFEELEERIAPVSGGCATSSSCECTSTSCVVVF